MRDVSILCHQSRNTISKQCQLFLSNVTSVFDLVFMQSVKMAEKKS